MTTLTPPAQSSTRWVTYIGSCAICVRAPSSPSGKISSQAAKYAVQTGQKRVTCFRNSV